MDLKAGQAVLLAGKGEGFDPAKIAPAVKQAGFTPGEIKITAVGRLAAGERTFWLEMPGPVARIALDGGKAEQLGKQPGMIGWRLRVDGRSHDPQAGQPPRMSVERWTVESPPG